MLRKLFLCLLLICSAVVLSVQPVLAADNEGTAPKKDMEYRPHLSIQDVWFNSFDKKVNNGEPIKGVDISSIISLERAGIEFYGNNGEKQDIFKTLSENGVNYIRVRIWNQPCTNSGESYGGGNCDVKNAAEIGKRAAKYGMKLLADFQYSDFWADPEKQTVPKAWANYSFDQKKQAIYDFTMQSLKTISESGADIGMVQVGNETNCFFCGEKDMYKICELFSSGCKAVREFSRDIMIALHFANPSTGYYDWYAKVLNECNVDYDVFATSYYPYWHGTTQNLTDTLKKIGNTYNKYVMVAETAYPYTSEDGDTFGNAVSEGSPGAELRYEISVRGQSQCLLDVFKAVSDVGEKGIGVFYWEPAWIGKSGLTWEEQSRLWTLYGSGWATDFAGEYDKSADKTGGSSYDNQGLFDFNGVPLDSIRVFTHIFPQNREYKYNDGKYIKSLKVSDSENAMDWFVHKDLRQGDRVFGDRDYVFKSVPDAFSGAEWISTACDSKKYGGNQAEFIAGENIVVYIGIDDRIKDTLIWLNDWQETDDVISDNGNPKVDYQVFRKKFKKSETVTLGAVENIDAVNYFLFVKPVVVGDVDLDGILNIADLVMLQGWLVSDGELTDFEAADLCKDGEINIFDLFVLKKEILRVVV